MSERFLRMLGLCAKAGRLVSGEEAVRLAATKRQACLIVLDSGIAPGAREKYERLCTALSLPLIADYSGVGPAIGKESRMAAAVTDRGFAEALHKIHTGQKT